MPYTDLTLRPARPTWPAMLNGMKCRCPNCGQGKLFSSYLKVADQCDVCGTEFFHHRADDAPADGVVLGKAMIGIVGGEFSQGVSEQLDVRTHRLGAHRGPADEELVLLGTLDDPQNLHNNHWEAFAGQLAVSPRLIKNLVQQQAGRLHDEVDNWLSDFRDQYGQLPALEGVQKVVTRQTRKALRDWT